MSPEACKHARGLLGWSMQDLADASQVHKDTIRRFEGGGSVLPRTIANLRAALESAGVEFVETKPIGGVEIHLPEGVIVRLRRE